MKTSCPFSLPVLCDADDPWPFIWKVVICHCILLSVSTNQMWLLILQRITQGLLIWGVDGRWHLHLKSCPPLNKAMATSLNSTLLDSPWISHWNRTVNDALIHRFKHFVKPCCCRRGLWSAPVLWKYCKIITRRLRCLNYAANFTLHNNSPGYISMCCINNY